MPVPLIPRAVLFGDPERLSPALAPSGRRIAFLAPSGGALNIWVATLGDQDARPVTADRDSGVHGFAWTSNDRYLVYLQDREGDEHTHLYRIDLTRGHTRDLTPGDRVQARIVGLDQRVPDHLLVGLNLRSTELHDVYRLHLASGELTLVAENQEFTRWIPDCDLRLRGAVANTPGGGSTIMVRDHEQAEWRPLYEVNPEDATTLRPLSFTTDGRSLLVLSSRDAAAARLLRLDLTGGGVEVLYEDPAGYDVVGVDLWPDTREPRLVIVQRQRDDIELLDSALADDIGRLQRICRGSLGLRGRDHADRVWLVQDNVDDGPAAYHTYDRHSSRSRFLFTHHPELERYTLARMEPFRLTARDGLTMHGYLTFPPGAARRALPTVLAVHGGPWTRDNWGFRAQPQWLANRGYLCVQVNFRGSTGYGKNFLNAGNREWGGRMQDDLIDAVRWVVGREFADPERVAIYGGSYGGYAALVGAAFTPEVFRCAVAVAAPSDLRTFVTSVPAYWKPALAHLHRRIGDPAVDADFLWSRSPLSRVDHIRIPILLAHGANDPRVRREESERIVADLRRRGVPCEYLLFPDEGHGFIKPRNRLAFYEAAERFLARHLGGRCEPASPDARPAETEGYVEATDGARLP